jgi:hypothetical protein
MCRFSSHSSFVKASLYRPYRFLFYTSEQRFPQLLNGRLSGITFWSFRSDRRLLDHYFAKVHFWFPFLDPTLYRQRFMTLNSSFTSEYCMFMLVMALGSLAEQEQISNGIQWAEYWAKPAFSMLPMVMMETDLTAVHCLILFR